jgi:hypothetical protein
MISEPDYENLRSYKHDRTAQVWSLVVSVAVNLLVWILITWHVLLHLTGAGEQQKPEQIVEFNSSQIQIRPPEPRAVPREQKAPPPTAPKPQPQRALKQSVVPRPKTEPTELARITPNAPPQPHAAPARSKSAALAEQLAQQEVAFAREAQQLNNSHSPVEVATADPNMHDQVNNSFRADFAGTRVLEGKGEGWMMPVKRWSDSGENCYYGRYTWIYPTGGSETDVVPWAFCFTPQEDPFTHGIHQFPFPLPHDPGVRVAAGAQLQPIEKMVYEDWLEHQ